MIYVDSNVFIYAVGRAHPLRSEAQDFFISSRVSGKKLVTSAEVLQELLHVYLPVRRVETLDAALQLAFGGTDEIIPIEADLVMHARRLAERYPALSARDLLHLSICRLKKIKELKTFDRSLMIAFRGK
ncbi:MAG: type II toxin-antitoxin system VapC family toxin [Syntrophobacteraceae bacterium]